MTENETKKKMIPYDAEADKPEPFDTDPILREFFERMVDYQTKAKAEGKLTQFNIDQFIRQGIGRNDPCPCGSKKKFKKCCMNGDLA